LPVGSCLLTSGKRTNRLTESKELDKRSNSYKRRVMALKKAPEVMLELIDVA